MIEMYGAEAVKLNYGNRRVHSNTFEEPQISRGGDIGKYYNVNTKGYTQTTVSYVLIGLLYTTLREL